MQLLTLADFSIHDSDQILMVLSIIKTIGQFGLAGQLQYEFLVLRAVQQ
jgi:hypothetical protein